MNQKNNTRELVVIGAGPGGYAAAFHAADCGVKVTLIDKEKNRGCIPSKALLHVAKIIKEADLARNWGINFGPPDIDIDQLRDWKNKVVSRLTNGLGGLCKKRKIEYIRGTAEFTSSNKLKVNHTNNDTEEITFAKAIIATGSRSATIPNIPMDSDNIIDSDISLELIDIPETMLVIGGGYIGLEQGNIYARLGTRVSLVEMTPQMLPGLDEDLVSILTRHLDNCFEKIMLNTKVSRIEETGEGFKVWFEGDAEEMSGQTYNKILVAVGRKPNTDNIGLENTKVQLDDKGFIRVDPQRNTDDPYIFAIGDITGEPLLAHKATHEGLVAAKVIAGRQTAFDPRAIPFVVFSELEVATHGLNIIPFFLFYSIFGCHRMFDLIWAAGDVMTRGFLIGGISGTNFAPIIYWPQVGIVGSDAGKLISEGTLAIEMAAVAADLARTVHPHPTLSETLMEAAEQFEARSVHL